MRNRLPVSGFGRDVTIAVRRLRRAPAFALTAVVVLGLGLGVGTAFFNIVNGGWFKLARLAPGVVRFSASSWSPDVSGVLPTDAVAAVIADPPRSLSWTIGDTLHPSTSARIADVTMTATVDSVSGPYFSALGAVPVAGRLLSPLDDRPDQPAVAVISERLWRTSIGGETSVIGRVAYLAGQPVVIVGVVDPSFTGFGSIRRPDIWTTARVVPVLQLYGRLRDGVTIEQANAEIRTRYRVPTETEPQRTLEVRDGLVPGLPVQFVVLISGILAVTGLVLVVAAASLTLMFLARILSARGDVAVRLMLGASVWQIARLWAAEVALIALAADAIGLAVAAWLSRMTVQYFTSLSGLGLQLDTAPDWRVACYVVLLTLMVLLAIVTVLVAQLSSLDAPAATSAAAGTGGATPRDAGSRTRLVTAQVAIATCLLLLAAFLVRGTSRDLDIAPGFDVTHVAVARIDQTGTDQHLVQANDRRALDAATTAPGVTKASLTTGLSVLSTLARTLDAPARHLVAWRGVTSNFFETLGLPIRLGRGISIDDERANSPVAVVSEGAAAMLWPGRDPIGQPIWLDGRHESHIEAQVVGVVADATFAATGARPNPDIYLPYDFFVSIMPTGSAVILARGSGPASAVVTSLRENIGRVEPQIGFTSIRTMNDELQGDAGSAQLSARVLMLLGLVGLVLAVTGLYGLTSFLAAQRQREFGIRKALGATPLLLSRMVASEGVPPIARGAAIGAFAAVLLGFWLRARQFHSLRPFDAVSLVGVSAVLVLAGLVGTVLPFWRLIRSEASAMLRDL